MARIREQFPNFLTICNLLAGTLSILCLSKGLEIYAAALIFIAAAFDVFDGAAARLLSVNSEIGKELDSLADLISFGLAPSFILYAQMTRTCSTLVNPLSAAIPLLAFLLVIFTAIRLANFNVSKTSSDYFTGLPCPASGLLIASIPFILKFYPLTSSVLLGNVAVLVILIILLCTLMNSKLRLLSLKFQGRKFRLNETRILLLICSGVSILIFRFASIPFILLFYFFFSYIHSNAQKTS